MSNTVLEINNLKMKYSESTDFVLKGINLEIESGNIIGYIGPNGAGKTTTVKILLGIIENYIGKVKIFNNNIFNKIKYKKRIGYVPEKNVIYDNLTAKEYLNFIGEIYGLKTKKADNRAKKLMSLFGIKNVYNSRISSFSKGMKQKILIISSLIHNPDLIFLDEPLNGLDANSVMIFKKILNNLKKQGKTIIYCSHIMDVVEKISDKIVLIDQGKIIANDSFEKLKKKSQKGSLEGIFNKLTGFSEYKEVANDFIEVINN